MNAACMPRKPKTYKLDERLIAALDDVATRSGESVGSFVEKVLWRYCQGVGAIDPHSEPSKDKRGGKREGAGRKPIKSQDDVDAIDSLPETTMRQSGQTDVNAIEGEN